jgi:type IV pilus assembly protein PilM
MLEILSLKKESFGLDLSDLSLKFLKLKKKRNSFKLSFFGEQKIKPELIKNGEIKDEDSLAKIIKEAILKGKGDKLNTRYVIASLPEEKSFVTVIQMPKIKEEELKTAVYYEAENHIPLPLEEVYLDFQIINPLKDHMDHMDILLVAFPRKIIDSYISCFKKAGLQPLVLELESLAIARSLIKDEISPFPILLIDLGEVKTSFIIFSGSSLRFTSFIPVSSQEFTEIIIKNLKVNPQEAENLKTRYGLEEKSVKGKKVFESLIPPLIDLVEQIKKQLYFYETHSSHEHLISENKGVQKIFLSGGGANLKGLTNFLSEQLKIPVELSNPWINIFLKSQNKVPPIPLKESFKYATAIGLALRAIKQNYD